MWALGGAVCSKHSPALCTHRTPESASLEFCGPVSGARVTLPVKAKTMSSLGLLPALPTPHASAGLVSSNSNF